MDRKNFGFDIKEVQPNGVFSGYGSVYGVIDQGDDIVAHGAFADSLVQCQGTGRMPAMLWQHDSREPIGVYTAMKEDASGLFVQGQICMDTQRGAEAFALMKMKAISGMSVGFMTREDSFDQKTGVRTIKKADLWECSVVTFPMNDQARVSSVKSIEEIENETDAEKCLRDAGMTRTKAKAFLSRLKCLGRRDAAEDENLKQALALLAYRATMY